MTRQELDVLILLCRKLAVEEGLYCPARDTARKLERQCSRLNPTEDDLFSSVLQKH